MLADEILERELHTDSALAAESSSWPSLEAARNDVWIALSPEAAALLCVYDYRWHGY